jgi:hypothetical protein
MMEKRECTLAMLVGVVMWVGGWYLGEKVRKEGFSNSNSIRQQSCG